MARLSRIRRFELPTVAFAALGIFVSDRSVAFNECTLRRLALTKTAIAHRFRLIARLALRSTTVALSPIGFPDTELPSGTLTLRQRVREFLANERVAGHFEPSCDGWLTPSVEFSRKMGRHGFLGLTWPESYGGQARTQMDRFVVTAEALAWGAPVARHWIADRQTGPLPTVSRHTKSAAAISPANCRWRVCLCDRYEGTGRRLRSGECSNECDTTAWRRLVAQRRKNLDK